VLERLPFEQFHGDEVLGEPGQTAERIAHELKEEFLIFDDLVRLIF
jgi:hypothetical protein